MKILILNGSPKKRGTVAVLLGHILSSVSKKHDVEWIDVYDLQIKPCIGCMKCRPDAECRMPEDDAHKMGHKIREADILVVGTPTHWGNMSTALKLLFDRNVPVFMSESPGGLPIPCQKGKKAVLVAACTTPWPFNFLLHESRGAINALREILHYGGYRVIGTVVKAGTKASPQLSRSVIAKAMKIGDRL